MWREGADTLGMWSLGFGFKVLGLGFKVIMEKNMETTVK